MVILLICLDNIILCLINQGIYSILLYIERKVLSEVDKVLFVAENPKDTFVQLHPDILLKK